MKINKKHCLILLTLLITFILALSVTSASEISNDTETIEKSNENTAQQTVQEENEDTIQQTSTTTKTDTNSSYSNTNTTTRKNASNTLESEISQATDNQEIILTSNSTSDIYTFSNIINIKSLNSNLNNLTITGESGKTIIFDGQSTSGLFTVNSMTLTLKNIHIVNTSTYYGVITARSSTLILNNCTITDNNPNLKYSVIISESSTIEIINSKVLNNKVNATGIITAKNSIFKSTNTIYINNTATTGGALYLQETNATITNSEFINNQATQLGGAIAHVGNTTLTITSSTFTNNTAVYDGGSIYTIQSNVTISSSTFTNNKARNGGAVYVANNVNKILFTIKNNIFNNNMASDKGDAIWTNYDSTITNNAFISTRNNNWVYGNANRKLKLDSNWWSTNSPDFNTITNIMPKTWRLLTTTNTTLSNTNTITVSLNKLSDQTTTKEDMPARTVKFTADTGVFNKTIMSITSNVTNTYTGSSSNILVTVDNQQSMINTKIEPYLSISNVTAYYSNKVSFDIVSNTNINDKVTLKINNITISTTLKNGKQTVNYTIPSTWNYNNYTTILTYNGNSIYDSKTVYGFLNYEDSTRNITIISLNSSDLQVLTSTLPSAYDLRNEGLVTSVKIQGSSGCCWAFSSLGSLETVLLRKMGISYNLSENNMKNLLKKYSIIGDSSSNPNTGNNDLEPISYLVGWYGPVNETSDPYDASSVISPIINSTLHVQDVYIIRERQNETDNTLIKQAIYNYGGVSTGIHLRGKNSYTTGHEIDHGVVIVGWDDNYSRYNFSPVPPADGAFIVKNSWGTSGGDNGYYYVSYYDTTIGSLCNANDSSNEQLNYVVLMENNDNYTNIYQYDSVVNSLQTSSNKVGYRNVYTAEKDEYIASVGSYFMQKSDYEVNITINGQSVYVQTGTVTLPGYRTIKLDQYVQVNAGDEFIITLKINRSNEGHQYILVQYSDLYYSPITYNQSFLAFDDYDTWIDLYEDECVAPLKVYTKDVPKINNTVNCTNNTLIIKSTLSNVKANGTLSYYINDQLVTNANKTVFSDGAITTNIDSVLKIIPLTIVYTSENYQIIENITVTNPLNNTKLSTILTVNNPSTASVGANVTINGKLTDEIGSLIANANITVSFNGKNTTVTTDTNGIYTTTVNPTSAGISTVKVYYNGDDNYESQNNSTTLTVNRASVFIVINKINDSLYGQTVTINGTLSDAYNNLLSYKKLQLTVNNITYNLTTNALGVYMAQVISSKVGSSTATVIFSGDANYNSQKASTTMNIYKQKAIITINSLNDSIPGQVVLITGTLKDASNNPFANKTIQMTVNTNTYNITTNVYGIYNKSIEFKSLGTKNITVTFKDSNYNTTTANASFNVRKLGVNIAVDSFVGIVGEKVTLKATVTDENDDAVTQGNLVFKLNGRSLRTDGRFDTNTSSALKLNVTNGIVTFTMTADVYLRNGKNVTASYSGASIYEEANSGVAQANIQLRYSNITVSVKPASVKQYEYVTFTAKVSDVTKNTKNTSIINENGYVMFKVNGVSLKDSNASLIKVKLINGVATYNYLIEKGTGGIDNNRNIKNYTVTAVHTDSSYYPKDNKANASYTVQRSNITITIAQATVKSSKLTVKGNITDYKDNLVIGTNKVAVKINGATYKENGSYKYFTVTNGLINLSGINVNANSIKTVEIVAGERQAYLAGRTTTSNIVKS